MNASFRPCLPLALLVLAACSPKQEGQAAPGKPAADSPIAAANAEFARLQAQGPEATAREFSRLEYPLTRSLMQAAGMDAALGGPDKAEVALTGLFQAYEQGARALQVELPKVFLPVNEGGGGAIGVEGYGGAAASAVLGGIQNNMAQEAWGNGQADGQESGHQGGEWGDTSASVDWTRDGYTSTTTVKGKMPEGLEGSVTTIIKSTACPDANGKIEIEFESRSDLSTGSASAQTKVTAKLIRHLDDDANLVDGEYDSESHVEQTTGAGSHVDVSDSMSGGNATGPKVNGQHGASSDDVKMAQGLMTSGRYAATLALESAKKAWESGKCVKLEVRSDPAKRKGARPNTAYTLFAEPRAKSDGMPTGGTVKATLNGGNRLNPTGKVKADAKFDYANPEKKDQVASIDFEARSKRGVGKATLDFDTKKGGYRITLDNGESITTCDITKPFSGKIGGGMITLNFTPDDDKGGRMAFHFANARGMADTTYGYTLSGPEERMTGSFQSTSAVRGQGSGRMVSAAARKQGFSSTWTRIEDCDK